MPSSDCKSDETKTVKKQPTLKHILLCLILPLLVTFIMWLVIEMYALPRVTNYISWPPMLIIVAIGLYHTYSYNPDEEGNRIGNALYYLPLAGVLFSALLPLTGEGFTRIFGNNLSIISPLESIELPDTSTNNQINIDQNLPEKIKSTFNIISDIPFFVYEKENYQNQRLQLISKIKTTFSKRLENVKVSPEEQVLIDKFVAEFMPLIQLKDWDGILSLIDNFIEEPESALTAVANTLLFVGAPMDLISTLINRGAIIAPTSLVPILQSGDLNKIKTKKILG